MHDPEFEKQVQKKLEELQFNPSGEVWTKVEKEIKKEKRRRPLLWIFLLSGLLIGAGYYLLVNSENNPFSQSKNEKVKSKKEDDQLKTNSENENKPTVIDRSIVKNNTTIRPKTSSSQKKSLDAKQSVPIFQSKNEKVKSKKEDVAENDSKIVSGDIENKTNVADNNSVFQSKNEKVKSKKEDVAENDSKIVTSDNENKTNVADNNSASQSKNEKVKSKKEDVAEKDSKAATGENIKENKATDSQVNKTSVAKNVNNKKSKSLRLGFTGGAGVSNIKTFSSDSYSASVSSAGGYTYIAPSSIQSRISFYAGAFLEKTFSKKISLSAGLNYHYYSTRVLTGKTVDSVIFVQSNSNSNSSASSPVPVATARPAYYTRGTTNAYTNSYHFFELPLLLNLRINSNNKLPIIWKGGFSFSYLINTNALQFDPTTGVYYKDNSLFNKTQVNAITGLMVGFYERKNLIQIGPEIQYGLTKILQSQITNNHHMLYYGFGINIVPQKK